MFTGEVFGRICLLVLLDGMLSVQIVNCIALTITKSCEEVTCGGDLDSIGAGNEGNGGEEGVESGSHLEICLGFV